MPATNKITTDLTPVPSRAAPSTFSAYMDAFLAKMPTWATQANALADEADTNADTAAAAAVTATTKAGEASASAQTASEQAAIAVGAVASLPDGTISDAAYNPATWDGDTTAAPSKNAIRDKFEAAVVGVKYARDDDGTISGGTWAIDYANGPVIKATAGANITSITMSNWPATGTAGHLRLMLVNFGAYTITFPAAWKWILSDLTTSTTFADLGVDLPSSGTAIMDLFSDDGGTTLYASIVRG